MRDRMGLDAILKDILRSDNVYFQPPEGFKLSYPCIIYEVASIDTDYADDYPYRFSKCYQVTLIDRNPDSQYVNRILSIQTCRMNRAFTSDRLYHYVFKIYY